MNYVSRTIYGLKSGLWALFLLSYFNISAQKKEAAPTVVRPGQLTLNQSNTLVGSDLSAHQAWPSTMAFRQELKRNETARQRSVSKFLNRNPSLLRQYTDAKGVYYFLHHIDPSGQPIYYQTRSNLGLASSINTNKLWQGGSLGLNLQGQGMEVSEYRSRLGMWEPGPARISHREFTGRAVTRDTPVFTGANGNTDHATHVAGTMIAKGINPLARGMANEARLDCYEIQTDEYTEMQTAAEEGMLVSNHSYGPELDASRLKLGVYDESCRTYDNLTFLNKNYLQFHAAGNDRNDSEGFSYDLLMGSVNAKNIVTVGAVKRLEAGYKGPASVEISYFSSYGPTDDGRIKPDIVAPGVEILSPYSVSDEAYSSIDGTSMASPGAAGSLFLLQQHYRNTKNKFMRAATLKGLAIHTADEAGSSPGPDYVFGWGLLNLEKAIDLLNQTGGLQVLEEASLDNGASFQKVVTTAGGPFKTTICWTDIPGKPLVNGGRDNRTPMLVNDLDVRLIDMSTNQEIDQLPWKLDPANPTAAATRGDNLVDNVEQIVVDNLPAGQYTIQVTHKGTLQQGPQEFSLLVSSVATGGPIVKVNSTDPTATEGNGTKAPNERVVASAVGHDRARTASANDPGLIRFERSSAAGPLVVNYQIGGTASNGVDFTTLPTSVTFSDGQLVLIEEVDPLEDDLKEGDESIIITLLDSDSYDPDPDSGTTTVTIKDKEPTSLFGIGGVTMVSCQTVTATERRVSFTPQYTGATGSPISFSVVNELSPTIAAGPYTLRLYTDNPTVTLKATQLGAAAEASFVYNWLAACTVAPTSTDLFGIGGVTMVSCQTVTATERRVSFTPQYTGATGSPISFSVVNELSPTIAAGPYTLRLYTDNPTVTLKATQLSAAAEASFVYNWLASCDIANSSRLGIIEQNESVLEISLKGNPILDSRVVVEIRGAGGQPLLLELTNSRGNIIDRHGVERANSLETHIFEMNHQPPGLFFLRATTPSQRTSHKLVKAE